MSRDQVVGWGIFTVSILVIVFYGYVLFLLPQYTMLLLQITAMIAVAGVFGILAWIGYTLATTPPPKPIEEIEKEIEEELKKVEQEAKLETAKESQ
ncbi:MAG: transcriptional regulator [Desulfurococcaceae archaeon]